MPHLQFENTIRKNGINIVVGIDEVGRGCFAGPVVAACVGYASGKEIPCDVAINDSKKITQIKRNIAKNWIVDNSLLVGIGQASISEINEIGIGKASFLAMKRAVINAEKESTVTIEHLLVDGFTIPHFSRFPQNTQTKIIKGDQISFSIASASIIAKVYRDSLMVELSKTAEYKAYGWDSNKGYGTKTHQEAIFKYGITPHHRTVFVDTFLRNKEKRKN